MNILKMTNTFTPHVGGVARSVQAFSEAYRQQGHEVMTIAPEFPNMPQEEHKDIEPQPTFFSRYPVTRIEHIFVDQNVEVLNVEIPSTRLTRVASDHLPLVVDIAIPRE